MTTSESGLGDDWSTPVGIDYVNSENGYVVALDATHVLMLGDDGSHHGGSGHG